MQHDQIVGLFLLRTRITLKHDKWKSPNALQFLQYTANNDWNLGSLKQFSHIQI